MTDSSRRSLHLTADLQRAYSRGGNFHADEDAAQAIGLPGLVAQGMQVLAPGYGLLLDEWGEALLAGGELEVRFLDMVVADETVDAEVAVDGDSATVEVVARGHDRPAVVGTVRVRRDGAD